jgi:isopenicillin-N N-acyltransferase-like protein
MINKRKKRQLGCLLTIILLLATFFLVFIMNTRILPPKPSDLSVTNLQRTRVDTNFYVCGNSWLKKNNYGLWELYIEGDAFERGVINGKLTKELISKQEDAFIEQIDQIVPSRFYLHFLHFLIAWFNRNIDKNIEPEYLLEIYGVSLSASDDYGFIGSKYERILNYHGAHDIGHALQDYHFVGCTSFSTWGSKSDDSTLLIGRNFDFYVGDKFAEDKIVFFCKPDKGYNFMMVTWAGMIGAVSGMNEKGLTITLNAGKSEIPYEAATPISIIAREILQYAKNINEAFAIAKKHRSFVSESIMIGSLEDNKTVIIEKTPLTTTLYASDTNFIICANHFQSKEIFNTAQNQQNMLVSSSLFRYKRVKELLNSYNKISTTNAAEILRNRSGIGNKNIGLGNEKSINQLIAHHSVIFKPALKKVWVSTNPYQLGAYVVYDLEKIFADCPGMKVKTDITCKELTIPADSFLTSKEYMDFLLYNKYKHFISFFLRNIMYAQIPESVFTAFIGTNPQCYIPYMLTGDYYHKKKNYIKAIQYYKLALTKEIATLTEKNQIDKNLGECLKKADND